MSSAQETVQKLIQDHDVAIFSKSYCPYCRKAKNVIDGLHLDSAAVGIIELDLMGEEGSAIQDYLEKETGQRTVPNVWIKQKFIGGSSDLAAIPEEDLVKRVK